MPSRSASGGAGCRVRTKERSHWPPAWATADRAKEQQPPPLTTAPEVSDSATTASSLPTSIALVRASRRSLSDTLLDLLQVTRAKATAGCNDGGVDPEELASALQRLADWAERYAPNPEPAVRRRLREHFGTDPSELPVVSRPLEAWDRPNVQVALDAWLAGREFEVVGLAVMEGYRAGLAELVRGGPWASAVELGGVEHVTVPLGERESVTCVQ